MWTPSRRALDTFKKSAIPSILAASAKIMDPQTTPGSFSFAVSSIDGRNNDDLTAVAIYLPRTPKSVRINARNLSAEQYTYKDRVLCMQFPAHSELQSIDVLF
jgi:hypothetical protein